MDPHYEQRFEKRYNMMPVKPHIFAMFFGISGEASIKERKVVEDGVKKEGERNYINEHSRLERHCAFDEKVKHDFTFGNPTATAPAGRKGDEAYICKRRCR